MCLQGVINLKHLQIFEVKTWLPYSPDSYFSDDCTDLCSSQTPLHHSAYFIYMVTATVVITNSHIQHMLHENLRNLPESKCDRGYSSVTQRGSMGCSLTNKGSTGTLQCSLLQVFPVEIVFPCNVVEDGPGLHHLHPIDLHHGHLLEQQVSIWGKGDKTRRYLVSEWAPSFRKGTNPCSFWFVVLMLTLMVWK